MSNLSEKHCVPCEGGVAPLTRAEAEALRGRISAAWKLVEGDVISTG